MSNLKLLLIIATLLSYSFCELSWGKCPNYTHQMESFDLSRYTGKWYEIARFKTPFQFGECDTANYSLNADGTLKVVNSELRDGEMTQVEGTGEKTDDQFRFKISFSKSFFSKFFKGDYRVVYTDYEGFSVVYSCSDLLFSKVEYVWILSRTSQLDKTKLDQAISIIPKTLNLSSDLLRFTNQNQTLCGY
jgi:apolipoprotein D and lipocalin family protein